jgi:Leucine-rich repeat (LRR) protein
MAIMDATPEARVRWFHPTPGRFVIVLLAVECLLWLSERFGWLGWHKGYAVLTCVAAVGLAMLGMLVWFGAALVLRRRFQFSIRSLLVLVIGVAVPCSWLAVEIRAAKRQKEVVEAIVKVGGVLDWDLEPRLAWLRNLLGDDFFMDGYQVDFGIMQPYPVVTDSDLEHLVWMSQLRKLNLDGAQITDAGLEHLKVLTQLEGLMLGRTKITDAGLQHIGGMKRLEGLCLENTQITDAGLRHLGGLAQLRHLALSGTKVGDDGLEYLKGLTQLSELYLSETHVTDTGLNHVEGLAQLQELALDGTEVSDAGLEHLRQLTKLSELDLSGTKVTDAGVAKLQQALPNCTIHR